MKKMNGHRLANWFKKIVLVASLTTLAACGGGGGGGEKKDEFGEKPLAFPLSVTVSGLTQSGLVLQNNSANDLAIATDGSHTFSQPVAHTTPYAITVKTQPTGQVCTVKNGSGIAVAAISPVSVVCSTVELSHTIGGTVTGLSAGEKVILANNDNDFLIINANQPFTFATPVALNSGYKVTVAHQPDSQICTVTKGTGSGVNADVTNVSVICSATTFSVGGSVTGLNVDGLVILLNNSADSLIVRGNESFSFSTRVAYGSEYRVTVANQPEGQICTVTNGTGFFVTSDVTNIEVVCSSKTFTIGGAISGLSPGEQVILVNNSDVLNGLTVGANEPTFTFKTPVVYNSGYRITVSTQPIGKICTVTNGTGNGVNANITNVAVICSTKTYSIGGTIEGLNTDGLVVLLNNSDDALLIEANKSLSSFTFPKRVSHGSGYRVTVTKQPVGQFCTVNNGSGSLVDHDITDIEVKCSSVTYTIGGSISGLNEGEQVTLTNNGDVDNDTITITTEKTFTFKNKVAHNSSYRVTVATQPIGQLCEVKNGTGDNIKGNVTNVEVTCSTNQYTIGGTISGLNPGNQVTLLNKFGNDVDWLVRSNGTFTFVKKVPFDSNYEVTVAGQPVGQNCQIVDGTGTGKNVQSDVNSIKVSCVSNMFSIGGSVSGLQLGQKITLTNGNDVLEVSGNGNVSTRFTFNIPLQHNDTYAIEVTNVPVGMTCTPNNGSGTVKDNVIDIEVTCSATRYSVSGTLTGLSAGSSLSLLLNDSVERLNLSSNQTQFNFVTPLAFGSNYTVTVETQPPGQTCTVSPGGGKVEGNIKVDVSCSALEYAIPVKLTGLGANKVIELKNNATDKLQLSSDGQYAFAKIAYGSRYAVTISAFPLLQDCEVKGDTGTVWGPVNPVEVSCKLASVSTIHSFSGQYPVGLVQAKNGDIYGTATLRRVGHDSMNDFTGYNFKVVQDKLVTDPDPRNVWFKGSGQSHLRTPPYPTGLMQATDGNIYGTTFLGGGVTTATAVGAIFSLNTASGKFEQTKSAFPDNVQGPVGGLIQDEETGYFYGVTYGDNRRAIHTSNGSIFKWAPAEGITVLPNVNFGSDNGYRPNGKLVLVKIGNEKFLYGTTEQGGANLTGTIFRYNLTQSKFERVQPFGKSTLPFPANPGIGPSNNVYVDPYILPYSGLIKASDGNLYGVVRYGGTNGTGSFFKVVLPVGTIVPLYSFDKISGYPSGELIQLSDGNFYGTTQGDGGTVFSITPGGLLTTLHTFKGNGDGNLPSTRLIQGPDGSLYGGTGKQIDAQGLQVQGALFKFGRK